MKRKPAKYLSAFAAFTLLMSLLCLSVGAVRQEPCPVALGQADSGTADTADTAKVTAAPAGQSDSTTGSVVAVVIAVLVVIAVISLILILVPKAKAKGKG